MSEKIKIGLLFGGRSGEHEVSLRSAAAVYRNLDRVKYDCELIGISKEGKWYLQDKINGKIPESLSLSTETGRKIDLVPAEGLSVKGNLIDLDLVLPIIHGSFGEDGTLQGALEMVNLPYAGSGVLGSALGMDKAAVKKVWEQHNLPVVPYKVLSKREYEAKGDFLEILLDEAFTDFTPPLFIKPNSTGSSLGVRKVATREETYDALREAFRYDRNVLIEQGISGKEIECAVLGGNPPEVSVPGQILPKHEFYDYDAKYVDPDGAELLIPADLPADLGEEVRELAGRAFLAAEAEGFSRVDFFVERDSGRIYINEINTIPGFTSISMFPLLFQAGGKSFREIIDSIIEAAFKRAEEKREILYSYQ